MNKAHTATANRISRRYNIQFNEGDGADFHSDQFTIEVETTATIEEGLARLERFEGPVFIAMTNMEGVREALRQVQGTRIGVMDPQGNIVKPSAVD